MALHIVILGPAHPFRGGGITTFNERLARALQEAGHRVEILNFTVQYPAFLFPGKSQTTDEAAPSDLIIEQRLHSMNPLNWWTTGEYLRKKKPDLILVRYWLPFMGPAFGTVLRRARKNHYTKIIALTDNVQPHEKRLGDQLFTRYFLPACDAFITMSKKVEQDLRAFVDNKPILQVRHPLYDNFGLPVEKDSARKRLNIHSDTKVLLFFGFIRAYKGLDLLLKALPLIREQNMLLLVAGEFYEDPAAYHKLIKELGIETKVKLMADFIPSDQVRYYFSAADLVVQPYRNATQSGVTPLAYHFEKPMVVTNVGGLPDYVEDGVTGLLAEPEPSSLANAINRFFEFGEDRFSTQIREKKKELSWPAFIDQLLKLFHRLK
ncbi:glycosyltransferase family 4 protein [Flavihumibacter cheonanensis]|uniref:glycosyltransferase n=1 Tax=Flavihumibacter cheonanensis TaxID=1442385 RepID=UPI001EF79FEB|nr:glycosyltransferase [Flavihumibacter cheonanensis]MCG7751540.1 glycosyltransferase [Flavihumibacter cheonanensis]